MAVTEHFAKTWAKPENDFQEAERDARFALQPRITDNNQEEMEGIMEISRNSIRGSKVRKICSSRDKAHGDARSTREKHGITIPGDAKD
jgi:hypothetical protein